MKLIHLSDLHLGKRINEFSLLKDQESILEQILTIIKTEKPDAVLIAGDVYDKPIPSIEGMALLDGFLVKLAEQALPVFLISGNHDSPERLSFVARLMKKSQIYISPVYNGLVEPITLQDEHGPVDIFLLPFIKPVHIKRLFPEEKIETYTDAVACAVRHMAIDVNRRNVLVTHQFVTGATRCDSEEISIGGSDNVDVAVFEPFDYVALGHLHSPQNVIVERVRYCGTPLKYSFSEIKHKKSLTVVELGAKGKCTIRTVPLVPQRDLLEVRGTYLEITNRGFYQNLDQEAYIRVILTDEEDIPDAVGKLRVIYPNLMQLDYDNRRTRGGAATWQVVDVERQTPLQLFDTFYQKQNNSPMSEEQRVYLAHLIETVWEDKA